MFSGAYGGRRVLVTGHTGFKGSWLTNWLLTLGAEVAGYSNGKPSDPCHFSVLGLENTIAHHVGDVRDRAQLCRVIRQFQPEIIFHLAAQALVRRSYTEPALTFETNTMGTMNILECARECSSVRAAVIITSDKCYRNAEWLWGYRENDILGGDDPYSASKACAELICAAYMKSVLQDGPNVATTRAGNVIGGGDWACDRIVPDCVRSWSKGEAVVIRHPSATRPWQHVLEPVSGYLWLGVQLLNDVAEVRSQSFNFGPRSTVTKSVQDLLQTMKEYWGDVRWEVDSSALASRHESRLLKLNCDKAHQILGWCAILSFEDTVRLTGEWYRTYYAIDKAPIADVTTAQTREYCALASRNGLAWAS